MKRAGLAILRAIDPDDGGPVAPEDWTRHPQSGGWTELRHPDGHLVAVYRVNTNATGTRGLYALLGERAVIDAIAAASDFDATLRQLWANRANATVRAVLRRWRDWRIDGFIRDAEGNAVAVSSHAVTLMQREGFDLPDPQGTPLPWNLRTSDGAVVPQAQADVRVTAIVRPALLHSMAAPWADHEDAEATT